MERNVTVRSKYITWFNLVYSVWFDTVVVHLYDKRNNAACPALFPSNSATVSTNTLPPSGMIRANLIKSFQAEGGKKRPYQPLCLWYYSQHSERGVFLRWNTAEERKGLYTSKRVVRPLSSCRWLNFARIPRTKIAIRAGATSEFFMPASRGYGKKQLPLAVVYFLCTFYIFLLSSLSRSPDSTFTSFFLLLPSSLRFSAPFTLTPSSWIFSS